MRGRFPELADRVGAAKELELEPLIAASGEPSARIPDGLLLHSGRDPRAEARRLVRAVLGSAVDTLVLLGLGLGYAAEACLESEVPRLIACEADPGALAAAFRLRDFSRLLADERLGFVVGGEPEALISALELSGGSRASAPRGGATLLSLAPDQPCCDRHGRPMFIISLDRQRNHVTYACPEPDCPERSLRP